MDATHGVAIKRISKIREGRRHGAWRSDPEQEECSLTFRRTRSSRRSGVSLARGWIAHPKTNVPSRYDPAQRPLSFSILPLSHFTCKLLPFSRQTSVSSGPEIFQRVENTAAFSLRIIPIAEKFLRCCWNNRDCIENANVSAFPRI